ncbi:MAG TPA: Sec-independent protein translocase protein TatB [Micavibrio sp.]|jgi:sec-independent protein translocase protein TatB
MLDVGFSELVVIVIVAILVIGPRDIPKAMMTLGRIVRRLQYVKFALSQQFEDLMKETDLQELRDLNDLKSKDQPQPDEAASDSAEHADMEEDKDETAGHSPTRH